MEKNFPVILLLQNSYTMDATKITQEDFLDILFAGRNKAYGAYALRRCYDTRVRNALTGTAAIAFLMVCSYTLSSRWKTTEPVTDRPDIKIETSLRELEPEEPVQKVIPPPATNTPPPAAAPTQQFTTPQIVQREPAPEEELPPQEALVDKKIGVATTEGDINGVEYDVPVTPASTGSGVVDIPAEPPKEERFTWVEIMPEYPGGQDAMMKYLQRNVRYPSAAQENGIDGTIIVSFLVDKDGFIKEIKSVGPHKGGGLEEEAIRVVSKMPRWKPGKQNGKAVMVQYNLPIRFSLQQ